MMVVLPVCIFLAFVATVRSDDYLTTNPEAEALDDRIRSVVEDVLARQASVYDARITEFENRLQLQDRKIKTLEAKGKRQQKVVDDLTRKVYDLTRQEKLAKDESAFPRKIREHHEDNVVTSKVVDLNNSASVPQNIKHITDKRAHSFRMSRTRATGLSENVAFTAYLDHDINHMADGHTVKFNRVHLNEGSGYNSFTGAFTVPVSGVYLFTYHWNSHFRMTILELLIDGVQQAAAIASPVSNHEAMGGQTVIVRVNAGQAVWIEDKFTQDGELFIGGPARYATFAGILMF